MALKCECGGEIRETIDNMDECIICGNTKKGGGKMAKEHDFKIEKVSGTATVIDNEKTFTTYREFAEVSGYCEAVGHFTELKEGEKVRLLAKGEHEYPSFGIVYVVETDKGVRHLIGHKGIKIDEPAQIPEQTYAEIAEPFGKQFRDAIREAYARGYEDGNKQANFDVKMDGMRISEMMREESPQEKVCDVQSQRDRIVEQAKADVGKRPPVRFVVNKEKRTIVALHNNVREGRIDRGIAKCAPGDCFNIHIGKAVALRKALGKSIDDYMDVPNPTEVRVGDIVQSIKYSDLIGKVTGFDSKYDCGRNGRAFRHTHDSGYLTEKRVRIIDDSREAAE